MTAGNVPSRERGNDALAVDLELLLDTALRRGLDDRRWLSSPDLGVLVSPCTVGGRADLRCVVTDERHRSFSELHVAVIDASGRRVTAPFDDQRRAVLVGVGPAPWRVRVLRSADAVAQFELGRRAMAAGAQIDDGRAFVTSADGRVVVQVHEDDDRHLQIEAVGRLGHAQLARFRWVATDRAGHERRGSLLTPVGDATVEATAAYDLGPLADATALRCFPVEIIDASAIDHDDLAGTVNTAWRGSARRAWARWLAATVVDDDVRATLAPIVG